MGVAWGSRSPELFLIVDGMLRRFYTVRANMASPEAPAPGDLLVHFDAHFFHDLPVLVVIAPDQGREFRVGADVGL